jgi:hypothetical protein
MRRLTLKLLILFVPIGLPIIAINYFVDPANIFSGEEYIEGIANIMAKGHNVDNIANYDERLLQEQMIKRLHKAPDLVVLGSSRIMQINNSFFPGKTLLNCGVSHGNVNDITAIVGALDSMKMLPGEMIIGLDHWLVGKEGTSEWQSLYGYHQYMMAKLFGTNSNSEESQQPNPSRKLSSLVEFSYFKSSLKFMMENKSKKYVDVGLNSPTMYGRFSDGSISYSKDYTNPDRQKLAIEARQNAIDLGLPVPDLSKVKQLEKLLDFLQEKKIKVHLIMVPLHPEFNKGVQQHHKQIVEEWTPVFNSIVTKHQIPYSGSFNAEDVGMTGNDFYDAYHCSGVSIKKQIPIL